ncbi:hypothetical protein E3N88_45258 [Mikania micrantha]|uniref:RNA helicase n=1 Tax=Mikania micrantha TaxID=192012 RepID=A0A5N6L9M4_9ASTR|nr:hypothetical protein E3N88_45258 [Mikania micrantha]
MILHRSIPILKIRSTSKLLVLQLPDSCCKFNQNHRVRAFSAAVDTFFADQTVSWSSLGAASIPPILAGNDVVVAAETGSGKTHGYLVPLFHKHLCTTTTENDEDISLVLCPNVMLCEQVVRMATSICNQNGQPLLRVATVCGRQQGWPFNKPNIIVSTPAALLNYLHYADLIRDVKHVVFDEADMLLCGTTLPDNGKRTAGGELKRLFPDATWVSGHYLHRHNPRLQQKWIEVTIDTQVDVLIDAVNHTSDTPTMVFANTVEAVEAIAKVLLGAGIECYCYHSDSSLEARSRNLFDFQQKGGIFVCTDAAARGIDIPNVSHVIQAEFATSAVDFLHRVGRTARAGQPGLVTSMYNETNRDLVAAVRQAGKLCQPVEKAFSRKRSFRKKLKKQGARGEALNVQDRIAV